METRFVCYHKFVKVEVYVVKYDFSPFWLQCFSLCTLYGEENSEVTKGKLLRVSF